MHRRRRTALALSAALLLGAPLLSACGSDAHPGAAAVVGGERIEVSTVQAMVKDVRAVQSAELIKDSGQLSRAKLYDLIVDRVVQRAADDAGVTVSRKELQDARGLAEQSQGKEQLAAMYIQQGVAPGRIDDFVRRELLVNKVAAALGATDAPDGQQKVNSAFIAAAEALHIDVNPRFGDWDPKKLGPVDYRAPWITQVTKTPEPVGAGA
ncbi:SurA N-terminal domain-containing protein [Streptomyces sp. NPDC052236]|uniref:SurA N-terminal domain-containing protein n=1 Tax=Streptomyces sp. NPDC052236 TaxID=3365686 RepID=UPI0037CD3ECA